MAKVLAVIHHLDDLTSIRNAELARDTGCAGVAVIEMNGRDEALDAPAVAIKERLPSLIVCTNRLAMMPAEAVKHDYELGLDGTWIDNPGVNSLGASETALEVTRVLEWVREDRPDFLFFGSVAFKTQAPEPFPGAAAMAAAGLGWIPTTSGPQTGVAPDVAKIVEMRNALSGWKSLVREPRLAIASGMTPENVGLFAPLVDWVLVSTGVSADFHNFDRDKLSALVRNCSTESSAA